MGRGEESCGRRREAGQVAADLVSWGPAASGNSPLDALNGVLTHVVASVWCRLTVCDGVGMLSCGGPLEMLALIGNVGTWCGDPLGCLVLSDGAPVSWCGEPAGRPRTHHIT